MKRILTFIMCIAMLILIPIFCIAEENEAWKNNTGTINLDTMAVTGDGIKVDNNIICISKGGDFEVTGTSENGMIQVNSDEKVKLRLSGISLTNTTGPAIYFENTKKGFITITEGTENFIMDSAEYTVDDADAVLFSNDDLEIKGEGKLIIDANYKHGIASDDDLKIENGDISISSFEHGLKSNNTVNILGGNIDINAETGKGIKAEDEVIIDAGTINIVSLQSEGIESKGIITINGGDINITAQDDGINTGNSDTTANNANDKTIPMPNANGMPDGEMPQGGPKGEPGKMGERGQNPMLNSDTTVDENNKMTPPKRPDGEMPQGGPQGGHGGMGRGFGIIDEETAKAHEITINGGQIYINANGDGIDSNGNLTVNGGTLIIDGPKGNGDGPLDSEGTMTINGGEIITLSSAGMLQLPQETGELNILKVCFEDIGSAGDVITLKDADSSEIMSHTAVKEYQALIWASDKLKENSEYSVYLNGEPYQTVTITKGVTSVGNALMGGGRKEFGGRGQENRSISVVINGQNVKFDTQPVIKNDTTLVGFRAILELLGADVVWDDDTQSVTAKKDGIDIKLTINSDIAYVNGEEKKLLTPPEIIDDSTMIPIRFISETLGMTVDWDDVAKRVTITSDK